MLMENHGRQKEEKERREEPMFSFLFRSFYPKFKISCPHMFTCFYPLTDEGSGRPSDAKIEIVRDQVFPVRKGMDGF